MASLNQQHILIIGGSSGIGLATAELVARQGANVIVAARDLAKLNRAVEQIGHNAQGLSVDITDPGSIAELFGQISRLDHVAVTGPAPGFAPFAELDYATVKAEFNGKFWGQWLIAKAAAKVLPPSGSLTLMSGAYSQRPVPGATSLAAVQAGMEGLVRGLAIDLAPIRVNAVSPGLTDTPLIRGLFGNQGTDTLIEQTAATLPARHVAKPADIAETYAYLMSSRATSGSVLFPDGGYTLR